VQLIVEPVETAMLDVFDQGHAAQWRALRAHFFADNEEVKAATRELIDTSFRKLRSAEGAFDLLQVCCSVCAVWFQTGCQPGCVAPVPTHASSRCTSTLRSLLRPCLLAPPPTQNFKSIKSRGAIQQQMMNKLVDTLEQFLREVIAAQEIFDRCKGSPPLTRNQPPVAGAGCVSGCMMPAAVPSCRDPHTVLGC
jgi:dynein heavy chain